MSPLLVLTVIAAYFAALFLVSHLAGRHADNQGFFIGNRKSSWYVVAFAMIGSSISGVTFISVPGWVSSTGFSYLQMVLGFVAGQFIIAFVLIPLFYRMNLISIYGYLSNRFGRATHKTGVWFFFISKMLGASVRLFLVCVVFQLLVFEPLKLPFALNVVFSVSLVWLYTVKGGVKSLIWTDTLKTCCLIVSVVLCICYISSALGFGFADMLAAIGNHEYSETFFFDDFNDRRFFFKQFLAGVFTSIATTGLDQDMMQRNLSCKNFREAQKNMMTSSILQFFVISMFLMLGVLLYIFADRNGVHPEKSDELFPMIATQGYFPVIVGVLFVLGVISSAYSAAGSALTSLTTSFTVDILESTQKKDDAGVLKTRKRVHAGMAATMGAAIILFNLLNNTNVVDAVYILASYTYGPILGMFAFGIFTKKQVRGRYIPLVALVAPVLCFVLQKNSAAWFNGYKFSYELLIFNALFTFIGFYIVAWKKRRF
ncbi:MAG: sodium:solute symporter [Bacteroidales bacterium]|jgi:Na+/proline symporter|nr:sodium:solute symporter [Bacteroidales bacterium]